MRFFLLLNCFISTIMAVNIVFWRNRNGCSGNALVCGNIGQNTCCGLPRARARGAIQYQDIPPSIVRTYGNNNDRCNSLIRTDFPNVSSFCIAGLSSRISGGSWQARSLRRTVRSEKSEKCQRPDSAIVENRRFNITGLSDEDYNDFLVYVDGESLESEIPAKYKKFEMAW